MGDQVRELLNWARQRKILAAAFVSFTLVVGIPVSYTHLTLPTN